jgi:hypothetical protein
MPAFQRDIDVQRPLGAVNRSSFPAELWQISQHFHVTKHSTHYLDIVNWATQFLEHIMETQECKFAVH